MRLCSVPDPANQVPSCPHCMQGLEDEVVPPNQAQVNWRALAPPDAVQMFRSSQPQCGSCCADHGSLCAARCGHQQPSFPVCGSSLSLQVMYVALRERGITTALPACKPEGIPNTTMFPIPQPRCAGHVRRASGALRRTPATASWPAIPREFLLPQPRYAGHVRCASGTQRRTPAMPTSNP